MELFTEVKFSLPLKYMIQIVISIYLGWYITCKNLPVWNMKSLHPAVASDQRLRLSPFKDLMHPIGSITLDDIQQIRSNGNDIENNQNCVQGIHYEP